MKMIIAVIAMLLVSGTIAFAANQPHGDDSDRQYGKNSDDINGSDGNGTILNNSADSDEDDVGSNGSDEDETSSNDSDEDEVASNDSDDNEVNSNDNREGSNDNNLGQQLRETIRERHVDQLNCNAQYLINVLDYISANSNDTSAIDQAKSDLIEGINGINTSSKKEYRASVNEYRDSVSRIRSGMVSGVREIIGHKFKVNSKNGNESELKDFINEQRKEFRSCFVNATRNRISAEVHLLQNKTKDQEDDMDRLGKKNVSTNEMRKSLDELNGKIRDLESNASQMDDENKILEQKQQYMGDIRFLWIQLHANKIGAILAKAKAFDVNSTYASNISAVQSLLDQSVSVGDDKSYTQAEYEEAKGYITSAADEAKSIVKSLKGNKG